jgi:hypothetical protein
MPPDVPHVVEVSGRSMEPLLPQGARVVVRALQGLPAPGDVVLFRTPSGLLLHRVVGVGRGQGGDRVFHRGDAARAVGVAPAEAALGIAVAVLFPPGLALPRVCDLDPARRRGFARARRLVRAVIFADAAASHLGRWARPLRGPGLALRRRLLGA